MRAIRGKYTQAQEAARYFFANHLVSLFLAETDSLRSAPLFLPPNEWRGRTEKPVSSSVHIPPRVITCYTHMYIYMCVCARFPGGGNPDRCSRLPQVRYI